MNKFVMATFPDASAAYEGVRALKELHAEGSLTLYGFAVVSVDGAGRPFIQQAGESGPLATAVGALAGGLVGLLAGPMGGITGAGVGALLGSVPDLLSLGVSASFLEEVSRHLEAGKTAVIADVREDWVTPLDARMGGIGASVVRLWRAEVEDDLYEREVAACRAELADLNAEFAQARTETRAKLKVRVDEAQSRLQEATDRASAWIERSRQETEARVGALQGQAARATGDARARLERSGTELTLDYERRTAKLRQALALGREALAP